MGRNLEAAHAYLAAVEAGATGDVLAAHLHPDLVQREHPNRLVPQGATRDLKDVLEGAVKGQNVVTRQRYEVIAAMEQGDSVAMEVQWSAVLKVPVGTLKAGESMRAAFAVFLTFRDGKVVHQRNFDCFDAF